MLDRIRKSKLRWRGYVQRMSDEIYPKNIFWKAEDVMDEGSGGSSGGKRC